MTLPNKILTRLTSLGEGILSVIDSKISNHNSSNSAHSDIRNNYVQNVNNYKHSHGYIDQNGEITETTSNPSKVLVTDGNKIKTINVLPASKVTHQSLDSKLNKNQGQANSGKFMKVQSSGEVTPETVSIPSVNVTQTKQSGVEIGSINGIKFYCNQDTTYNTATTAASGLMSSSDKTKLNGIQEGAKNVSFNRELNSGVKIGTLTIGNDSTDLYCVSQTAAYDNATTDHAGLMSKNDKIKLDGIEAGAKKVTFSRTINSGNKIGSIKIGDDTTDIFSPSTEASVHDPGLMSKNDKIKLDGIEAQANKVTFSRTINGGTKIAAITIGSNTTDIFSPDYTATNGIQVQNKQISHTNSVAAKTASSLYKIKYDAQGHITDGAAVGIDSTNGGTNGSSNLITSGAVYSALQNKKDVPSLSSTTIKDVQQAGEVRLLKYDKLVICDIVMHGWNVTEANANKTQSLTNAIPEAYRPSSQYTKHIRTSSVDPTKGTLKQQEIYLDVENVKTKYQIIFKCRVSGETNVRVQLMWFTD